MTIRPLFVFARKFETVEEQLSNGILKVASIHDKGKSCLQLAEPSLNQPFISVHPHKIGKPEFDSGRAELDRLAVDPSQTQKNRELTRDSCME